MYKISATILLTLSALVSSVSVLAQGENPFIGTWDINLEESNFGSATVPQNISRSYAELGDGNYMYLVVTTNGDGSTGATSASYSYSGEQYPIAESTKQQWNTPSALMERCNRSAPSLSRPTISSLLLPSSSRIQIRKIRF